MKFDVFGLRREDPFEQFEQRLQRELTRQERKWLLLADESLRKTVRETLARRTGSTNSGGSRRKRATIFGRAA